MRSLLSCRFTRDKFKYLRLYVLLIFLSTPGVAQHLSQVGRFSADFRQGCAPLTVNLTELDDFGDITRQYFYEGEASQTIDTFYTYTQPGIYQIVQLVGVDVDPKTDTLEIEVLAPVTPVFDVQSCEDNEVQITIEDAGYDTYWVSFSPTEQQEVAASQRNASFTYPVPGDQTISVRGRYEGAPDNCGSSTSSLTIRTFENLGTLDQISLTRSCLDNLDASISFTLDEFQSYELMFSEDGNNFSPLATPAFPATGQSFQDITNAQGNTLFFRLDLVSACSGQRLEGSVEEVENPIATAPSLDNAYVSWVAEGIEFNLQEIAVGTYSGRRRVIGFDWEPVDSVYNGFVDRFTSDFRPYEYEIGFADTCGNAIPAVTLAPAFIAFRETAINSYDISWDPPVNTLSGAFQHQLVISGKDREVFIDDPFDPVEIFLTEAQGANQVIRLETIYDNDTLRSNNRILFYEFRAYLADAFTPNDDGLNDFIRIIGINATEVDFKVFNRWGELIHRSTNPNPAWDGKVGGTLVPEDRYFYKLTFLSIENKRIQQQGSFVLLRK